jgi:hypothetical protein
MIRRVALSGALGIFPWCGLGVITVMLGAAVPPGTTLAGVGPERAGPVPASLEQPATTTAVATGRTAAPVLME